MYNKGLFIIYTHIHAPSTAACDFCKYSLAVFAKESCMAFCLCLSCINWVHSKGHSRFTI